MIILILRVFDFVFNSIVYRSRMVKSFYVIKRRFLKASCCEMFLKIVENFSVNDVLLGILAENSLL